MRQGYPGLFASDWGRSKWRRLRFGCIPDSPQEAPMSQPIPPALNVSSTPDATFPKLTPEQVARVAAHGRVRRVERGEVLVEVADHNVPFFVVKSGQIEIVRPAGTSETVVAVHGPGQFNGEVNMISGRRSLVRARVSEAGEVIEMDHSQMLSFVQLDN